MSPAPEHSPEYLAALRLRVMVDVLAERVRQETDEGFDAAHDDEMSVYGWLGVLTRHVGLAASDGGDAGCHVPGMPRGREPAGMSRDDQVRFRRQMCRVAAIAVAAVEALHRVNPGWDVPRRAAGGPLPFEGPTDAELRERVRGYEEWVAAGKPGAPASSPEGA